MLSDPKKTLKILPAVQEHVLTQEAGKRRFVQVVTDPSRAFALCAASDEAVAIRNDIALFQAVKSTLVKPGGAQRKSPEKLDAAIRQFVTKAIVTEGEISSACSVRRV